MLGIDWRAARAAWTVFLVALLIAIVYLARQALLVFIAAFLFAYILSPAVGLVCRITPARISRTVALSAVYLLLVGVIALLCFWLGGQVVEQANSLANRAPEMMKRGLDFSGIPLPGWLEPVRARLSSSLQDELHNAAKQLGPFLQSAWGRVGTLVGGFVFVVLVPILAFFMLKDAEVLRLGILRLVPPNRKAVVEDILQDINVMMAQYIRALLSLSIATTVAYLLFFELIGFPYPALLAFVAAPLEFIPFLGPLIAAVVVISVALVSGYPHVWWIVAFFAAYRMFQDYILSPYLMGSGVEIHPVVVIFGALAGEELGGVWGMFLSIPVMATLRVMYTHLRRAREQRELAP